MVVSLVEVAPWFVLVSGKLSLRYIFIICASGMLVGPVLGGMLL